MDDEEEDDEVSGSTSESASLTDDVEAVDDDDDVGLDDDDDDRVFDNTNGDFAPSSVGYINDLRHFIGIYKLLKLQMYVINHNMCWPFKNVWIRGLPYFHLKIATGHKHSPMGPTRAYTKLGRAA